MKPPSARHVAGIPARPIKRLMVAAETGLVGQPHDAQRLGHRSLPGARTAPATSNRMWFQTGAVKHGRKTASQVPRIAGASGTTDGTAERIRLIAAVESSRSPARKSLAKANRIEARGRTYPRPIPRVAIYLRHQISPFPSRNCGKSSFKDVLNNALRVGLRRRNEPDEAFEPLTFDMGKPRVDLTKAAALATGLEDDELVGRHRRSR